jgi:hypothetical protein
MAVRLSSLLAAILAGALAAAVASAQAPAPGKPAPSKPAPGKTGTGKTGTGKQDQGEDPALGEILRLRAWLDDYRKGAIRFVKDGRTDEAAIAAIDAQLAALAQSNTLAAAKLLFEFSRVEPTIEGIVKSTERVEVQRELQPWRLQAMARKHLRSMAAPEIVPWLLAMLNAPGVRGGKAPEQSDAAATLRVLAGHPSIEAQLELLRAARSLPPELRLLAVNALAKDARKELVPTLLELLRDVEPNIRIAAANALGTAMQPHVDESLGMKPTGDLLKQRDLVIERLGLLLVQDQIWQVRSAAAFSLAIMKCKPVIPALIHGLDAELGRKKDPWAMDVRLHKLLEGLTGQSVVQGSIEPWKQFWAREGASFAVRPVAAAGEPAAKASKYEKFFDLEVESDRVLFVLDFSGSMAEPVTLRAKGTASRGAQSSTKAALVVQELKKLVMSLPDGALVNFVVFGDEVRIWRQEGDRPALVKLDDTTRDDLLGHFLDVLQPAGATNLYGALDAALGFGGRGLHDKYYAAGFDTLYVITDGAPTAGAIVDKDEIRRRVREANQLRKIAIHCITFGDKNDTGFLEPMAVENGGRHIHVD